MKRFVLACVLCTGLLGLGAFVFMPGSLAKGLFPRPASVKENLIQALLAMPAPPPPNPLEPAVGPRDEGFYDPKNPPPYDAPIDDLIDYWTHQNNNFRGAANYQPKLSPRVVERLVDEAEHGNLAIGNLTNVLPTDRQSVDLIKALYDRGDADAKKELKNWLLFNSPYFSDSLQRVAE